MSTVTTKTSDPIRAALSEGYVYGVPPWCRSVEDIDGPIAREHPCDDCGKACTFIAMHHKGRRSYRAFARCMSCKHTIEF